VCSWLAYTLSRLGYKQVRRGGGCKLGGSESEQALRRGRVRVITARAVRDTPPARSPRPVATRRRLVQAATALADNVVKLLGTDLLTTGTWHESYNSDNGTALAADGFLSWDTLGATLQAHVNASEDPFRLQPMPTAAAAAASTSAAV
jgi:hypothetical protein